MDPNVENCPSTEIVADFGLGILDPQRADTISQHLETCVDCRNRAANVRPDRFLGLVLESHGHSIAAASPIESTAADASISEMAIPPALAVSADYEIVRAIGRGGMGVVYLARNLALDRLEALKVVSKSLLERPGAVERFQREMRSAARLNHPHIVAAYSAPRAGDLLVLAMEYVDGQNLAQIVSESGPLGIEQAASYVRQVALGLQHAYERGMVHRDIKPGNLMLDRSDPTPAVKILDFGLAKATSEAIRPDGELTASGQILGTPAYIAPEQTLDATHADIRADIYSLGCTMYFMLAGYPPFESDSLYEIMHAQHHVTARPLNEVRADVPAALAAVVAKMMAKVATARQQTPVEVAEALAPFCDPESSALRRVPKPKLSWPAKTTLLALVVAAVAAAAVVPLRTKTTVENAEPASDSASPLLLIRDPHAPAPAIAPFDAKQARARQQAWAKHLGIPGVQTNSIGMKLVLIPPGEFMMGSTPEDVEQRTKLAREQGTRVTGTAASEKTVNEVPQHRVEISRPFLLAATETEVGQFRRFIDAAKYVTDAERFGSARALVPDPKATGRWKWNEQEPGATWVNAYETAPLNEQWPISVVSWNDAIAFCNWLSEQENRSPCYRQEGDNGWSLVTGSTGYRLPTEAQWEYACRAGTDSLFSSGDRLAELVRCSWNFQFPFTPNSFHSPQIVGQKIPNAFGLYDMHGNVWEWCQDFYSDVYYSSSPVIDPEETSPGPYRVHRGGCWHQAAVFCRSAVRDFQPASYRSQLIGFRVVRGLPAITDNH